MKKDIYFERYAYPKRIIESKIKANTGMIIVIPCHNETQLLESLNSLSLADKPQSMTVEVIVVINHSADATEEIKNQNNETYQEAIEWTKRYNSEALTFHIALEDKLKPKDAGVGLARKIGMDEALFRFSSIGKENGIIVCFDADSKCETNYLTAIENYFSKYPKLNGCSIHFEHPINGDEFEDKVYEGISAYELHLRYYTNALKWTKHPHAFQTIGSSMAVKASAYKKQGGMNKRKAGEDFYFLQKIISLGNFGELHETKVVPSPRTSDRVPFGTGRAIKDWLSGEKNLFLSYHYQGFEDLKVFFEGLEKIYLSGLETNSEKIPNTLISFLESDLEKNLTRIKKESNSFQVFRKKFFDWFNAFKVLKFLHFCRDQYYKNMDLNSKISPWIFKKLKLEVRGDLKDNLVEIRKHDIKNATFSDF